MTFGRMTVCTSIYILFTALGSLAGALVLPACGSACSKVMFEEIPDVDFTFSEFSLDDYQLTSGFVSVEARQITITLENDLGEGVGVFERRLAD